MKRTNMQPERRATRRAKWVEYARRVASKAHKIKREAPIWDWTYGDNKGAVQAWTRSEAKSIIKDMMGINKRLPKEVTLVTRAE